MLFTRDFSLKHEGSVTVALFASVSALAEEDFRPNARNVPETLPRIPDGYAEPAAQSGQLVRLDYDTWESFTYAEHNQRLTKTAWVYLPYGYDENEKYNVFTICTADGATKRRPWAPPSIPAPSSMPSITPFRTA